MVIIGFFCGCLTGIGISYALYVYHEKTERFSKSLQYVMSQIDTSLYRGGTFYLEEVEFANVSFSTKQTPNNPHTKGSLKFKYVVLEINDGKGRITSCI